MAEPIAEGHRDDPDLREIIRVCSEFAAALKSDNPPSVKYYLLAHQHLQRERLFAELLRTQYEACKGNIDADKLEALRREFPEYQGLLNSSVETFSWTANASSTNELPATATFQFEPSNRDQGSSSGPAGRAPLRFGDYDLLKKIAQGGMGVVYKAHHRRLNRTVALKMILAGNLANAEQVQRFYAEAEAAAALDHPGIVSVFEVGEYQQQHFLAMAFVPGESLATRLADGPWRPPRAAKLLKLIADAVEYAHQRGIIHRDIKPGNILLDEEDQPRVADFGLAKRNSIGDELTLTGQILGTPSYMPPEQALGNSKAVGPVSDVYALGALLYAVLVGRPPFRASTPAETLKQVIEDEPVAPSSLNSAIPRDLETICLKCLEKDQSLRYQRASDVSEELQRFLDGREILARPISRPAKFLKWCRRNPILAGSGLAISLTLVFATAISLLFAWMANESNRESTKASQELAKQVIVATNAEDEALKSLALSEKQAYRNFLLLASEALATRRFADAQSFLQQCPPKERNVEWAVLWQSLSNAELDPRFSHKIQLSKDGATIFGFGDDSRTSIVSFPTRERTPNFSIKSHAGQAFGDFVLSSDDSQILATTSSGIAIYDAATGDLQASVDVEFLAAAPTPFYLTPNHGRVGEYFVYGRGVALFDVKTESTAVLLDPKRSLFYKHLCVAPNGRQLAMLGTNRVVPLTDGQGKTDWLPLGGVLQLGDLESGKLTLRTEETLETPIINKESAVFLEQESSLLVVGTNGFMTMDTGTFRPMAFVSSEVGYVRCRSIRQPNSHGRMTERLLLARADGALETWALREHDVYKLKSIDIADLNGVPEISCCDFNRTTGEYFACSSTGTYCLQDAMPNAATSVRIGRTEPSWRDDQSVWGINQEIRCSIVTRLQYAGQRRLQSWKIDQRISANEEVSIATLANVIAFVDPLETTRVRLLRLGETIETMIDEEFPTEVRYLAMNRQGTLLAVRQRDLLQIFRVENGRLVELWQSDVPATKLRFSGDGKQLSAILIYPLTSDLPVCTVVWDCNTGQEQQRIPDEWQVVRFGADGRSTIFAGRSGFLFADGGKLEAVSYQVGVQESFANRMDFDVTSDGSRILGFLGNREPPSIAFWDATDGTLLVDSATLTRPRSTEMADGALSVSADGRLLVSSLGRDTIVMDVSGRTPEIAAVSDRAELNRLAVDSTTAFRDQSDSAIVQHAENPQADFQERYAAPGIAEWKDEQGQLFRAESATSRGSGVTCCFSADGKSVVTTDAAGSIRVWESASGELKGLWIDRAGEMVACESAPGGHSANDRLLTADPSGLVRERSLSDGRILNEFAVVQDGRPSVEAELNDVTWHPTLRLLATHSPAQGYYIWDLDRRLPIAKFSDSSDPPDCLKWSPDGIRLASSGSQGVTILNVLSQQIERKLRPNGNVIRASLAWSPDGKLLAAGGGNQLTIWDIRQGIQHQVLELPDQGNPTAIAWSPTGQYLVAGSLRKLVVWNPQSSDEPFELPVQGSVVDLAFAPDGKSLVKTGSESIETYDLETKKRIWSQPILHGISEIAWLNQGRTLVTASPEGLEFVSVDKEMKPLAKTPRFVRSISPNRSCEQIAVAYGGPGIFIHDAAGASLSSIDQKTKYRLLSWNDPAQRLAGCTVDGWLRVWNVATGEMESQVQCPTYVNWLEWLPDGTGLVTGFVGKQRGPLYYWNARSEDKVVKLMSSGGPIASLEQSAGLLIARSYSLSLYASPDFASKPTELASYRLKAIGDLDASLAVDRDQKFVAGFRRQRAAVLSVNLHSNAQTLLNGVSATDLAWRPSEFLTIARTDRSVEFYDDQGIRKGFWLPLSDGQYVAMSPIDGKTYLSNKAAEQLVSVQVDEQHGQQTEVADLPELFMLPQSED